jgi:hypothetical protein
MPSADGIGVGADYDLDGLVQQLGETLVDSGTVNYRFDLASSISDYHCHVSFCVGPGISQEGTVECSVAIRY